MPSLALSLDLIASHLAPNRLEPPERLYHSFLGLRSLPPGQPVRRRYPAVGGLGCPVPQGCQVSLRYP
jgi:hypothetical protein